eukprot:Gb_18670 [translate_table: standard]
MRRAKFKEINIILFEKCMKIVENCLMDMKMMKNQIDEVMLVGYSNRISKLQQLLIDFFDNKQLYKSINLDEVVIYGVVVQAVMLNRKGIHLVLVDVTPLSLRVAIRGRVTSVVLPKNRRTTFFTTRFDDQIVVSFLVYQGERDMDANNTLLGEFLSGILEVPFGVLNIEVTFDLDENRIIKVFVKQRTTGLLMEVLRKEEIDRMLEEAKKFRV